jgi:hypothetical protein
MHSLEVSTAVMPLSQIDLEDLTGAFDDIAQLSADAMANLESAGIRLAPVEADEAGPVHAAAVQLSDGSQFLLVGHVAHPEQFIDVRATIDTGTTSEVAQKFLTAAQVPPTRVRWIREEW